MNNTIIQLLVLAGVALFLIIRLKNVLGTRDGFEPTKKTKNSNIEVKANLEIIEGGLDEEASDYLPGDDKSARSLKRIKELESSFSLSEFIGGAGGAYEMILMAFQAGNIDSVASFLSLEVKNNFDEAINDRNKKELIIESEFIGIRDTAIKKVSFNEKTSTAEICVSFLADIKSEVKNKDGNVVEGEKLETRKQFDIWAFSREIGSDNPNWLLIETGL
jgi:predicted lipid-binding transport protein (Tim44 family)